MSNYLKTFGSQEEALHHLNLISKAWPQAFVQTCGLLEDVYYICLEQDSDAIHDCAEDLLLAEDTDCVFRAIAKIRESEPYCSRCQDHGCMSCLMLKY